MRTRCLLSLLVAVAAVVGCSPDDEEQDPPGPAEPSDAADDADVGDDEPDTGGSGGDDAPADDGDDGPSAEEPVDGLHVQLERVADGLDVPNDLTALSDGRLLLSDQRGRLHLLTEDGLADTPVLDLTARVRPPAVTGNSLELGLSGVAAHPRDPKLYVLFTEDPGDDAEPGIARIDVLSEFTLEDGPLRADPDSERELLRIEQGARDHVGGHLLFGPDGMLYLGLGDAGVPQEASDTGALRGSVLRIDPDGEDPYAIPDDNPFVDGGGAPEVFASGFRNPFRMAWLDGAGLLVADPKWTSKDQEIHLVQAGGDHGWPARPPALPGPSCYPDDGSAALPECLEGPDGQVWTPPVVEYGRDVGQIVSGVAVYGATAVPELTGRVLVADWRGALLAATPAGSDEPWPTEAVHARLPDGEPLTSGGYLWSLDSDDAGEVYVFTASTGFDAGDGVVYRVVPVD